jgi:hypothetical protein
MLSYVLIDLFFNLFLSNEMFIWLIHLPFRRFYGLPALIFVLNLGGKMCRVGIKFHLATAPMAARVMKLVSCLSVSSRLVMCLVSLLDRIELLNS